MYLIFVPGGANRTGSIDMNTHWGEQFEEKKRKQNWKAKQQTSSSLVCWQGKEKVKPRGSFFSFMFSFSMKLARQSAMWSNNCDRERNGLLLSKTAGMALCTLQLSVHQYDHDMEGKCFCCVETPAEQGNNITVSCKLRLPASRIRSSSRDETFNQKNICML